MVDIWVGLLRFEFFQNCKSALAIGRDIIQKPTKVCATTPNSYHKALIGDKKTVEYIVSIPLPIIYVYGLLKKKYIIHSSRTTHRSINQIVFPSDPQIYLLVP